MQCLYRIAYCKIQKIILIWKIACCNFPMPDKYQNKYRIKSARCPTWDYRSNAAYFITICTHNRLHYFGKNLAPSAIGDMALKCWNEIPDHFPFIILDEFVVMPNHVHGIVIIDHSLVVVQTLHATPLPTQKSAKPKNEKMAAISPKQGSLGSAMRSYKSAVKNWCNKNNFSFDWQSRFHDHIIRDAAEYERIKTYIINNPKNWKDDRFYTD